MFNIFKQPYLENDDGVNMGGSVGATDAQVADVQNNDSGVEAQTDTGASDTNIGSDRVADHKPVQSDEDNAKYAAARREAETQARQLKERQDNFARQYGYESFEEMEYAQQIKTYTDQGVDPVVAEMKIEQDRIKNQLAMQGHQARIVNEKSMLSNQKFFKDLEPLIDATLTANPTLPVKAVFDFIKGQKMDELLAKESKAAAQRQLNNINNKSHIRPDGGGVDIDNVVVDENEFKLAKILNKNLTRDEWIKFKKTQK
ncbi:MAG: hypothetical protein N3I35_06695 [Clostridia bacterium]|nr:hypothetical protein [Clostridia bacterium]